jgi:hypothetical protein
MNNELPKDVLPKTTAFSITVELPVSQNILCATWTIPQWESLFANYRDVAKDSVERTQMEACRATLERADSCGATAVKLLAKCDAKVNSKSLELTFTFADFESLGEFWGKLEVNASGDIEEI